MYYAAPKNLTPAELAAHQKWEEKFQGIMILFFVFGVPLLAVLGAYLDKWLHNYGCLR